MTNNIKSTSFASERLSDAKVVKNEVPKVKEAKSPVTTTERVTFFQETIKVIPNREEQTISRVSLKQEIRRRTYLDLNNKTGVK